MARKSRPAQKDEHENDVTVATNRVALYDFSVEDRFEAGIALKGTEIKSIRVGRVSLREGFVRVVKGEAWLEGVHIAAYQYGTTNTHEPERPRKLLLHKRELLELGKKTQAQGYTVVPLHLYLRKGRAKVEIALARGKRQYDKRHAIAERESKREIARAMRSRDRD